MDLTEGEFENLKGRMYFSKKAGKGSACVNRVVARKECSGRFFARSNHMAGNGDPRVVRSLADVMHSVGDRRRDRIASIHLYGMTEPM